MTTTCSILLLLLALAPQEPAPQEPAAQQPAPQPTAPQEQGPGAARQTASGEGAVGAQQPAQSGTFGNDQLEQLVAPIALYPDALLAQVLMASTYPLEIVEAARWVQKNPKVTGDKLEAALKEQTWDPSVKSLCAFPDVLKRMNENLDWVQDLGDAFLAQKEALMQCVQTMRRKAYDSGNLKSGKEITVTEQTDKVIVIQSAQPEVVYVPTYYPTAVYGGWSYPSYYYPPMYPPAPAGGMFFSFTAGMVWGAAIWGDCDWGGNDVDIDIDNYNNFIDKTEIDGSRKQDLQNRASESGRTGEGRGQGKGKWNHDPQHRKGVGYKNDQVAQRFGGQGGSNRVSRDQARGFTDRGGQRPTASTGDRGGAGSRGSASTRPSTGTRDTRSTTRPESRPSTSQRGSTSTRGTGDRSGSFSGARSSSFDRASSSRGSASRGSMGSRGGRGGGGGRRGR
jgi:hypothetical protein